MLPLLLIVVALLLGAIVIAVMLRQRRDRIAHDDALKAIATAQLENRVIGSSALAGAISVDLDRAVKLIGRLQDESLATRDERGVHLTDAGLERAMLLLRAHRLMERYLVDETGAALDGVHRRADRIEHYMTAAQVAELNESLGHPDRDPHGDPIPAADGRFDHTARVPLNDWPLDKAAKVLHVEDEPPGRMRSVLGAGVRPGTVLRIAERTNSRLTLCVGDGETALSVAAAESVHVVPAEVDQVAAPAKTLRDLPVGDEASVLRISDQCRGLTRRRLLDLGLTPGATVRAELANAGRSAVAYRVRGTLIALRREQAEHVLIGEL